MLPQLAIAALTLMTAACSATLREGYGQYVLPLNRSGHIAGNVLEPVPTQAEPRSLAEQPQEDGPVNAQIARIVDGILASPLEKVAIYVHGGLVSIKSSIEEAQDVIRGMLSDQTYPVIISWDASGLGAYGDHLVSPRGGRVSNSWIYDTKPAVQVPADVIEVAAEAPLSYLVGLADSARSSAAYVMRRAPGLMCDVPKGGLSRAAERKAFYGAPDSVCSVPFPVCDGSPHFACSSPYHGASRGARARKRLIWTLTSPAKIFTAPFVYALGPSLWDMLKRRTSLVFNDENEFRSGGSLEPIPASGALAKFLDHLNSKLARSQKKVEIVLIGHSMGAFLLNEVLTRYTRDTDMRFSKIVYLAAASGTRDSLGSVTRYLRLPGAEHTEFYSLSLHPLAENREQSAGGTAPDGSLLVWIDSMFENSASFLERTFGRWENVRPALHLVPTELRSRMHFRVFGLDNGDPQGHGELNDAPRRFWRQSYWIGPR